MRVKTAMDNKDICKYLYVTLTDYLRDEICGFSGIKRLVQNYMDLDAPVNQTTGDRRSHYYKSQTQTLENRFQDHCRLFYYYSVVHKMSQCRNFIFRCF